MEAKTQKKRDYKEKKERKKQELKYYRETLDELVKDERRTQLAFPPSLDVGQRKKLHTYAHSIGLKSKSNGKGKLFVKYLLALNQFNLQMMHTPYAVSF